MQKSSSVFFTLAFAASGCLGLLSAQEIVVRDFTSPGADAENLGPSYWTPERRAAAIPMRLEISGNPAAGPREPVGPVRSAPSSQVLNATAADTPLADGQYEVLPQEAGTFASYPYPFTRFYPWTGLYDGAAGHPYPIFPYRTVGKLFFRLGRGSYVCSASVIRPHLVLTARHCVLSQTLGWATNVVFYPGYSNGPNPRLSAGWRARRLSTWGFSGTGALLKWDIGFIQTYDDDDTGCGGSGGGRPIETYTGFLGWLYGGDVRDRNYTSMGYPQGAPFDGKYMVEAHSDVGNVDPLNQPGTFSMGNDMTGGSSGGPWIVGFGTSNYANGLNSYKWTSPSRPMEMNSPNFQQDNFRNLLTHAQGLSCP